MKSKSKQKTPLIVLKERENISELSDGESSEDDNDVDFEFSDIVNGYYIVTQYAGKCNVYYAAVVTSANNNEMFAVPFFKCNRKKYFIFAKNDHDEVGAKCIFKKLPPPEIKQKLDQIYYYFNWIDLKIELQ